MNGVDQIYRRNAILNFQSLLGHPLRGYLTEQDIISVKSKQRELKTEADGVINYAVYKELLNDYDDENIKRLARSAFGSVELPLRPGSYGTDVELLNLSLSVLILGLGLRMRSPLGKYYGKATTEAVRAARVIFNLPPADYADHLLLYNLRREELAIEQRQKT